MKKIKQQLIRGDDSMKVNVVEIEEYFHQQLIKRELIPTGKDVEEIADIVFNFLLEKEIIEEL